MQQKNRSTLDGEKQAIYTANEKHTMPWRTICSSLGSVSGYPPATSTTAMCSGRPSQEKKKKQGTGETHHWQPSIISWEGHFFLSLNVTGKPEALHRPVRTAVHSCKWAARRSSEAHCQWARKLWPSMIHLTIYALRRWRSLIKWCLWQQQCVQKKDWTLSNVPQRGPTLFFFFFFTAI